MTSLNYCMCENTFKEMQQINKRIDPADLSDEELKAAIHLLRECAQFINNYGDLILEEGVGRESGGDRMKIRASKTREAIIRLLGKEAIAD